MTNTHPHETEIALHQIASSTLGALMPAKSSKYIDDILRETLHSSAHGERFDAESFTLEPLDKNRPSPFDVNYPYVVANRLDNEQILWAANTVSKLIIPQVDGDALTNTMGEIYYSGKVQDHLRLGGSVAFLSNHISYADLIAGSAALSKARIHAGESSPNMTQDVIAHRITSLFTHDLVKMLFSDEESPFDDIQDGSVLKNVILSFASSLQVLPSTKSGYEKFAESAMGKKTRKLMNAESTNKYGQLVRLGGRALFIAGSGTEAKPDPETGHLVEGTLGKGTIEMMTRHNQTEGSESLLAIPVMLYIDPFSGATKEMPVNPKPTPFAFLEPRFLKSAHDTHTTMLELMEAGNLFKPSGTPIMHYNPPGPDKLYKPNTVITHSHRV